MSQLLTSKDMTCLCSVASIYTRTEDNSLLRKSVGLSASLGKKKNKLDAAGSQLWKNIKDDRKSMMFWLFCSHYDIEQYAAKCYGSKVLQDHLLAE